MSAEHSSWSSQNEAQSIAVGSILLEADHCSGGLSPRPKEASPSSKKASAYSTAVAGTALPKGTSLGAGLFRMTLCKSVQSCRGLSSTISGSGVERLRG